MFARVIVCMFDCLYVFLYICLLVCMYVYLYACLHVWLYVCMYVCLFVSSCVCLYVCLFICVSVRICLFLGLYVCMFVCCLYVGSRMCVCLHEFARHKNVYIYSRAKYYCRWIPLCEWPEINMCLFIIELKCFSFAPGFPIPLGRADLHPWCVVATP